MNTTIKPGQFFDLYDGYLSQGFPELGGGPLSTEPYVSQEYFDLERERIFAKAWFIIGSELQLPNPGDYFVQEIPLFKTAVIVVRGLDGVVRGFHNVCPHRGAELVARCTAGRKRLFVCPFHSWSFDTTGELKAVPERDRFLEFDPENRNLRPVSIESWNGLLFFNLQPKPDVGLKEYLGELGTRIESYPFDRMRMAGSWHVDLNANWKVVFDAFQEGYHVATVHKNVAPELYKIARTGHARMRGFKTHGPHRTISGPKNPTYVPSPVEQLAFEMAGPSFMQGLKPGEELWPGLNLNNDPLPTWIFDINIIFPSSFIDISQGFFWTYEFHPISVNKTRYAMKFYITEPQNWSQRIGQEFLMIQLREALLEDFMALEGVQRGLETGVLKSMALQDQEIAIRHQYLTIDSLVSD